MRKYKRAERERAFEQIHLNVFKSAGGVYIYLVHVFEYTRSLKTIKKKIVKAMKNW